MKTTTTLNNTALTTTPMWIGGREAMASDGSTVDAVNPATGELTARFPAATAADVDAAVLAGKRASAQWKKSTPEERSAVLTRLAAVIEEHAEELADLDVADNGSPIREMRRDACMAVDSLRYYAGLTLQLRGETIPSSFDRINFTLLQPYGVVARIIPFNHPFMFAASKIAAPLAAGNAVIVKPSEHTSRSALRLGELAQGIIPEGLLSILTGYGHTTGDAIVRHPDIRRLAFIGSADTGRAIQATAASVAVKNVTLELGGKNPLVVFPDADIDKAVLAAQRGMNFTWQGQSCGSTSRLIVHRDIYANFIDTLAENIEGMKSGSPTDESTQTGSIVNAVQYDKVRSYIAIGHDEGARLIAGGQTLTEGEFANGFFVRPTLFADVDPKSRLAQEEIFGPVLAAMPFDDYDGALTIANNVRYGLTASVFTENLRTAHRFARDVEAGYVWVNEVSKHVHGTAFGGVKDSGLGREEGIEELISYTQAKNVHLNFEA
ncbi:aldehyde dehydrogenase family protein [Arthrobacter sp. efr-133-TYG-118]|uniref:aldehyde dehydrogenase family protein n=1 Tax=Arthrobacter sp. efr-133-TYG-118 TaxID=3040279 RepID=UPI00254B2B7A|nr:aldehyde dehydrogenase family protein [Arthrobacter sp. efr-133-TYG-118]